MPTSLCVPPRPGELCAPIRLRLPGDHSTQQLTSRHRVTGIEVDGEAVVVLVEITDPATSRPIDVRFDVVAPGEPPGARSVLLGTAERRTGKSEIYGTYLGVVADEN
ncbi:hypothetical protein E1293_00470 [Actinomadura darangshiensis]|uniref:Uncharacterized protein n=1 Tax=Actinomadura darangshiensis TaxID=705336 RepID=A0A4R5C7G6_9ACTN|nr:hypothetical protein [Actinomadura darangshiensis]TDD92974.1 hypothetical protein E1293_00470 [Actinomadura darangshiensis]